VLSAYKQGLDVVTLRSLTKIKKRSRPKIEPCCTPMLKGFRDEQTLLTLTVTYT